MFSYVLFQFRLPVEPSRNDCLEGCQKGALFSFFALGALLVRALEDTHAIRRNHNILTALGSSLRASIIKINAAPEKT